MLSGFLDDVVLDKFTESHIVLRPQSESAFNFDSRTHLFSLRTQPPFETRPTSIRHYSTEEISILPLTLSQLRIISTFSGSLTAPVAFLTSTSVSATLKKRRGENCSRINSFIKVACAGHPVSLRLAMISTALEIMKAI